MPAKKMRVEVFDREGNHYTVAFEGNVSREKAQRLLDIVELLGGVHEEQGFEETTFSSKFDKTQSVVAKHFPSKWFASREVLVAYEEEFNEVISLSTISTYLSRLVNRGFLLAGGSANHKQYRMVTIPTTRDK
jgi:hypothetical protein